MSADQVSLLLLFADRERRLQHSEWEHLSPAESYFEAWVCKVSRKRALTIPSLEVLVPKGHLSIWAWGRTKFTARENLDKRARGSLPHPTSVKTPGAPCWACAEPQCPCPQEPTGYMSTVPSTSSPLSLCFSLPFCMVKRQELISPQEEKPELEPRPSDC